MVGGSCCACGRWWSAWKPQTLCGARDALCHFGELVRFSGGGSFRGGLLHIGKPLMCNFRGRFGVVFMDMRKPWARLGAWELGEVVLHGWKPRFWAFVKLRGDFVGIWKLRGVVLRVWKLGLLAHKKLSVCIRGSVELRWLSGV